jgi:hypothetical protein
MRRLLAWYPEDIWRYVLAGQWRRIAEEEAFVGRAGEVGDELGSAMVAGRLVRDLMHLALLMRRRHPPYAKWLGTAFGRLPGIEPLAGRLAAVLPARDWRDREAALCDAYERLARDQNALGLAAPVDPTCRGFHERPFRVLGADRFAVALDEAITDPALRALPSIGCVDQFVDSTDVLTDAARAHAAARAVLATAG